MTQRHKHNAHTHSIVDNIGWRDPIALSVCLFGFASFHRHFPSLFTRFRRISHSSHLSFVSLAPNDQNERQIKWIYREKTAKAAQDQQATSREKREEKKVLVLKRLCSSKYFVIDIISGRSVFVSLARSARAVTKLRFGAVVRLARAHGSKSLNICYCQCVAMAADRVFAIDTMQNIQTFQPNWWRKKSQNQLFCGSFYDICTHMFPLRVHTICLAVPCVCALMNAIRTNSLTSSASLRPCDFFFVFSLIALTNIHTHTNSVWLV